MTRHGGILKCDIGHSWVLVISVLQSQHSPLTVPILSKGLHKQGRRKAQAKGSRRCCSSPGGSQCLALEDPLLRLRRVQRRRKCHHQRLLTSRGRKLRNLGATIERVRLRSGQPMRDPCLKKTERRNHYNHSTTPT